MSADFDANDLARLLALEHAFGAIVLVSATNHSFLAEQKPSDSVKQFRSAVIGSTYDDASYPKEFNKLIQSHLERMFDHIESMAQHADLGVER